MSSGGAIAIALAPAVWHQLQPDPVAPDYVREKWVAGKINVVEVLDYWGLGAEIGKLRIIPNEVSQVVVDIPPNARKPKVVMAIGRWDDDTLVVDTVGFLPGSLAGTLPHSGQLHVVERFTLNPATLELTRAIVAEDPV